MPDTERVIVRALPPIWGAPSPSPFVIKLLTWLRMAEIPHELVPLRGPPRSKTGKIPYVELPGGEIVSDSALIIERLSRERGVDLDEGLGDGERALGLLIQRTIEEHLYFTGAYERFATKEGFEATRKAYFAHMPAPLRPLLALAVRRSLRSHLHGQGIGRLPREIVADRARADLAALDAILGDRPHFLGDRPRTVDATAAGFLWAIASHPFESAGRRAIESHARLVAYLDRIRTRYWADWTG